ncbi:MAG: hypothetical protein HUU56_08755 [Bdellovibrionaceae bacterium]|nr:hypothetical protein [Pseudobdellovibrionaceae bacterium]
MKKRILFISETVTMAHLIRPLTIAKGLSLADYDIHFAATKIPEFLIKDFSNFTLHQVQNGVSEADFLKAIAKGQHPYSKEILKEYVEEDLRLLYSIKPDIIVGDMRLSLHISSQLTHIPYINISNSTWDPSIELPTLIPDIPAVKYFGVKLTKQIFSLLRTKIFNNLATPFNETAKYYGVSSYGSYYDVLTSGDYTLYTDLKSLVDLKKSNSSKFSIGALVYGLDSINLPQTKLPKKTNKRVILSLGSSGPSNKLEEMVTALSTLNIELIVATGGKKLSISPRSNVFIFDYIPMNEILKTADLLIFNGGSGSGYLALSNGVPLLCVPSNIDQHQFSYIIEKLGAASIIRSDKISSETLVTTVKKMLSNNNFKTISHILANEMKAENPIYEIDQVLKHLIGPSEKKSALRLTDFKLNKAL